MGRLISRSTGRHNFLCPFQTVPKSDVRIVQNTKHTDTSGASKQIVKRVICRSSKTIVFHLSIYPNDLKPMTENCTILH